MNELFPATAEALRLLWQGDEEIWLIIKISFSVSLRAMLYATGPALLLAFLLSRHTFLGRRFLLSFLNTMMAIPAVVVGLIVYLLLSHHGPLGDLKLLFTRDAMVIGQFILAFPIILSMAYAALAAVPKAAWETARTLGASPLQAMWDVMLEARFGLLSALIVAFSRIIAEIGSAMMVGGNILHHTRSISTSIALETSKGEFAQGIALGIVLLIMALGLNTLLHLSQRQQQIV